VPDGDLWRGAVRLDQPEDCGMSKRSNFQKIERDKYRTPREAVLPLLAQLPAETIFAEPCAGNGVLIDHLTAAGHKCIWASDIEPERADIKPADAMCLTEIGADMVITNPPWTRSIMHPLIDHLSAMLPCWFLFDASWAFTRQSSDLIRRCSKIVPIGRVKWFPDSPYLGMDDAAWYEFRPGHTIGPRLVPRLDDRGEVRAIRVTRQAVPVEIAPTPAVASSAPPAVGLLARLRSQMRPMNIPRLGKDSI
jgi:hypothetical protein